MPIEPGTKLGPYLVQEFIGQGAMGVVYRAYHAQLERTGAVKVLQGIAAGGDSTARFRREAQAIARMRHPNIVNVFDFGEYEGTPYMIVEYVAGGSLSSRVRDGRLDRDAAMKFLSGIAEALDYAHSLGIVHRDVKPANVLLGPNDSPILADFGLAKLMESSSIKSLTGVTTGTPAYMAPEQVTGSHVGPAADRYSLAVMAYEMLSGSLPFDEGGVVEVLYAHVHREPSPPSSHNPDLGSRVDRVILRGLAKEPAARWESCDAFVAALGEALRTKASPAVERTIAFAPPAAIVEPRRASASTAGSSPSMAADAADAMIRGPDESVALHPPVMTRSGAVVPAGAVPRERSDRGLYAVGAVILLLALVVAAIGIYEITLPTALSLSPATASPGDVVVVKASHVPRNQAGEIQLLSVLHTFGFRANGMGDVSQAIVIPLDIEIGDHLVRICWNGACHAETTLHVSAPVALASPAASPAATPGASEVATSPSPKTGASPPPAGSSPSPTHPPSSSPPPPAPSVGASPSSGIVPGVTQVTVTGSHFKSGTGTIYVIQGTSVQSQTTGIQTNGTFTKYIYLSTPPVWVPGNATLKVCDPYNDCAATTISIT